MVGEILGVGEFAVWILRVRGLAGEGLGSERWVGGAPDAYNVDGM